MSSAAGVRLETQSDDLAVVTIDAPPLNLYTDAVAAAHALCLTWAFELANDRVPAVAGDLFATEDLQRAVPTFVERGPGHAMFSGR